MARIECIFLTDVAYSEIASGEIFQYENNALIKSSFKNEHEQTYSLDLKTGEIIYLFDTDKVRRLNAKVVIQ